MDRLKGTITGKAKVESENPMGFGVDDPWSFPIEHQVLENSDLGQNGTVMKGKSDVLDLGGDENLSCFNIHIDLALSPGLEYFSFPLQLSHFHGL